MTKIIAKTNIKIMIKILFKILFKIPQTPANTPKRPQTPPIQPLRVVLLPLFSPKSTAAQKRQIPFWSPASRQKHWYWVMKA